jgi:hypothetical protein
LRRTASDAGALIRQGLPDSPQRLCSQQKGINMAGQTVPDYLQRVPDHSVLRTVGIGERTRMIQNYICQELTYSLDVPPGHRVSVAHSLRSHGMGSISALRLKRMLELALRTDVSTDRLMANDSVAELAAGLAASLGESPRRPAPPAGPQCPRA